MIKIILFLIALFYSLSAFGSEEFPEWLTNKPKNNSDYRYYIGNGSNGSCDEARLDVKNQIIDELGSLINTSYDSFLSESNASMQQNISQTSSVKLKNLIKNNFVEPDETSAILIRSIKTNNILGYYTKEKYVSLKQIENTDDYKTVENT